MFDRYSYRSIYTNSQEQYDTFFQNRNVKQIRQYGTELKSAVGQEVLKKINCFEHIWSTGDRFYKLAYKYFGDSVDWWIIAKLNNTPTESHVNIGDIIYIPYSVQEAIAYLKG